jgi:hypothetical protein
MRGFSIRWLHCEFLIVSNLTKWVGSIVNLCGTYITLCLLSCLSCWEAWKGILRNCQNRSIVIVSCRHRRFSFVLMNTIFMVFTENVHQFRLSVIVKEQVRESCLYHLGKWRIEIGSKILITHESNMLALIWLQVKASDNHLFADSSRAYCFQVDESPHIHEDHHNFHLPYTATGRDWPLRCIASIRIIWSSCNATLPVRISAEQPPFCYKRRSTNLYLALVWPDYAPTTFDWVRCSMLLSSSICKLTGASMLALTARLCRFLNRCIFTSLPLVLTETFKSIGSLPRATNGSRPSYTSTLLSPPTHTLFFVFDQLRGYTTLVISPIPYSSIFLSAYTGLVIPTFLIDNFLKCYISKPYGTLFSCC